MSFTLFNISSPSSLYFLSYFLYKFYITSFPPLSYIFSKFYPKKKVNTISISSILFLFWERERDIYIYIYSFYQFFSLMVLFFYCWFNFQITFIFISNKFVLAYAFRCYGVSIHNYRFFLYITLIWFEFGFIINCFRSLSMRPC